MDKDIIIGTNIALTNASLCSAIHRYYEAQSMPKMPSDLAEEQKLMIELQLAYRLLLEIMEDSSVVSAFEPFLRQSVDSVKDKVKHLQSDDIMLRHMRIVEKIRTLG